MHAARENTYPASGGTPPATPPASPRPKDAPPSSGAAAPATPRLAERPGTPAPLPGGWLATPGNPRQAEQETGPASPGYVPPPPLSLSWNRLARAMLKASPTATAEKKHRKAVEGQEGLEQANSQQKRLQQCGALMDELPAIRDADSLWQAAAQGARKIEGGLEKTLGEARWHLASRPQARAKLDPGGVLLALLNVMLEIHATDEASARKLMQANIEALFQAQATGAAPTPTAARTGRRHVRRSSMPLEPGNRPPPLPLSPRAPASAVKAAPEAAGAVAATPRKARPRLKAREEKEAPAQAPQTDRKKKKIPAARRQNRSSQPTQLRNLHADPQFQAFQAELRDQRHRPRPAPCAIAQSWHEGKAALASLFSAQEISLLDQVAERLPPGFQAGMPTFEQALNRLIAGTEWNAQERISIRQAGQKLERHGQETGNENLFALANLVKHIYRLTSPKKPAAATME